MRIFLLCFLLLAADSFPARASQAYFANDFVTETLFAHVQIALRQYQEESTFNHDIGTVATRLSSVMNQSLIDHYHVIGNVATIDQADLVLVGEGHDRFDDIAHFLAVANQFSLYDLWLESIDGQITPSNFMLRKISRLYLLLQLERGTLTYADIETQSVRAMSYLRQFEQYFHKYMSKFNWGAFSSARRVAGFENVVIVSDSLENRNLNLGAALQSSHSQGRRAIASVGYGHFLEHYYFRYIEQTGHSLSLYEFAAMVGEQMQHDPHLYDAWGWTLPLFKQLHAKKVMVLIPKIRAD